MKKKFLMLAVLTLLLTTACGTTKIKNGEEVVAKIEGKEYTADELYKELKGQYGYSTITNWIDSQIAEKEIKTTDEITSYVDEAIDYYTYYAEAYGTDLATFSAQYLGINGITDEDSLRAYILKDRKLNLAIEKQVASKINDKDVVSFYNENYKTVYTYRDIVIADDDSAKDTVSEINKALKDKKGDDLVEEFAKQAKEHSIAQTASNGGLNEKATKNLVDEAVWKVIKKLDNKEYSKDTVKAEDGLHLVLRISKDKAKSLDDSKEEIKTLIAQQKLEDDQMLRYDVLTELRNKYKIVFFDKDLKEDYNNYLKELEKAKKDNNEENKSETEVND